MDRELAALVAGIEHIGGRRPSSAGRPLSQFVMERSGPAPDGTDFTLEQATRRRRAPG